MKRVLFLFLLTGIFSCKPASTTSEETKANVADTSATTVMSIPGLKRLWDTEALLTTSESVLYDKKNNLFYVSCVNGVPEDVADGDGFIARISLDGKILDRQWVTGLSGPKGLGLHNNLLYVTDITRLVAIDITTAKISKTWKVDGSSYLNDIAVADDGTIYFTDTKTKKVYSLVNDKVSVFLSDPKIEGLNGICLEGSQAFLTGYSSGDVYTVNMETKSIGTLASGIPGGDGIERYGNGFLVSNWNGEVHFIAADGEVTELLDTQEAKLNAADIEVIGEKQLLLVPTFFGNSVTAYELSKIN